MKTSIRLPKRICSLDIETETKKSKSLKGFAARRHILVAGLITYTRHRGEYYPGRYRQYGSNELGDLIDFLMTFRGIIIGHNIFQFDLPIIDWHARSQNRIERIYARLGKRRLPRKPSLKGVIEKTVDTYLFACEKRNCCPLVIDMGPLSLSALASANGTARKKDRSIRGKVSSLWHTRWRPKVIEYNKNDCILTFQLWWKWVGSREFNTYGLELTKPWDRLSFRDHRMLEKNLWSITESNLLRLAGRRPLLTHEKWKGKISSGERILEA